MGRAIESYQKALNINPRLKEIHYNVALLYDQLENFNLAIGYYKQFINLSSASQSDLVSKVQMRVDELEKELKKNK